MRVKSGIHIFVFVGVALCFAPGPVWAIQLAWVTESPVLSVEGVTVERLDESDDSRLLALAANPRHHSMKHGTPETPKTASPEKLGPVTPESCQHSKKTRSAEPVAPQHSGSNAP